MRVDFHKFIVEDNLGHIAVGSAWTDVLDVIGEPELYEPPGDSSPGFARYGDLEFTIQGDAVTVISLQLDGDVVSVPQSVSMVNFEDPTPDIDDIGGLLKDRGVSWHRLELLSDEWRDAYCTERGVHLAFSDGLLAKVGASDQVLY